MKRFRFGVFIVSAIVIFVLTWSSFVAAFGRDEGTLEKDGGIVGNLLADSFDFFRQPTHGLFWDLIIEDGRLFKMKEYFVAYS